MTERKGSAHRSSLDKDFVIYQPPLPVQLLPGEAAFFEYFYCEDGIAAAISRLSVPSERLRAATKLG